MSITVTTDVFCDDCGHWIHGPSTYKAEPMGARLWAKKAGWVRRKVNGALVDLCAKCK